MHCTEDELLRLIGRSVIKTISGFTKKLILVYEFFTCEEPANAIGIEKIPIGCDFFSGSFVNTAQQDNLFCIV